MMQTQPFEKHVWAEIDLEALRHNFRAVKARAGTLPLCAVVKADSYGHGAVQCARVFAEEGAAWLAVSCLTEAVQLRKGGLTLPILVLGHVQPGYAAALIQNHITVACYSAAQAKALSDAAVAAGGQVQIHLKADTGMGRIGFALRTDFDAAIRDMLTACALPGLEMTGLFQHFSVADDVSEDNIAYTAEQHRLFVQAFHALKAAGQEPQLVHCDNSAGVMLHPDWPEGLPRERCMARPGIILYGYDPSDEVRFGCFKPVMTLKTVVSMIKEMQPGQCASYGRRFTAEKPTKVATLCTGYADGYPRLLSCGKGVVEIHGVACPVLGRVCMDQMMVDVTDIPGVKLEDPVVLVGRDGDEVITVEDMAAAADTFNYELRIGGKPFVIDTGISTYEKTARRQYERGTAAHNTVMIGDKNSSEVWGGFRVGRRARVTLLKDSPNEVEAWHDGFGSLGRHQRKFMIDKDRFRIEDSVSTAVKAVSLIHLAPDVEIISCSRNEIVTNIAAIRMAGASSVEVADEQVSFTYNRFHLSKTIRIHFVKRLSYTIG